MLVKYSLCAILVLEKKVYRVNRKNAVAKMCRIKVIHKHKSDSCDSYYNRNYRKKEQKELANKSCIGGAEVSAKEGKSKEEKVYNRNINSCVIKPELAENISKNYKRKSLN